MREDNFQAVDEDSLRNFFRENCITLGVNISAIREDGSTLRLNYPTSSEKCEKIISKKKILQYVKMAIGKLIVLREKILIQFENSPNHIMWV